MRLSRKGAQLIESFEGFRSCPYRDAVGVWTIGYGSTKGVGPNTKCISRAAAEDRMMREVDATYGAAVSKIPGLNQSQFDAMTSFVYNVGPGGIGTNTGVGRALRAKEWNKAANELLKWDKAGGFSLAGLTRRRQAERRLFLSGKSTPTGTRYTAAERRWMKEYDSLVKAKKDRPRRVTLRKAMTEQRKAIWKAAKKSGWDKADRRARYNSLLARTS